MHSVQLDHGKYMTCWFCQVLLEILSGLPPVDENRDPKLLVSPYTNILTHCQAYSCSIITHLLCLNDDKRECLLLRYGGPVVHFVYNIKPLFIVILDLCACAAFL